MGRWQWSEMGCTRIGVQQHSRPHRKLLDILPIQSEAVVGEVLSIGSRPLNNVHPRAIARHIWWAVIGKEDQLAGGGVLAK